ncbi:hypothetical protein DB356_18650 [Pseudomonas congelans]|uniref:hypothetical protein n=1 Tax=Pseudomonas congelans TaxID=200452 RepID=UPI001BDC8E34|nr:hypothetical protein [Pseudomonas congelans]QVX16570.1 hypothetical protein DB356_18650 [Pseudomonas congelans]
MIKFGSLSERSGVTDHFGNVEYLSAVDVHDEDEDLAQAGNCRVTFDAIPVKILPFLRRARFRDITKDSDNALSFLLLEAVIPTTLFETAVRLGGWCSITVSDNPTMQEGFLRATALEFSGSEEAPTPTTFYVRINPFVPDAKDLQALKRVIECRHYQSASIEYRGVQPRDGVFVAVYDVGQANMCAILDDNYQPKAFFDFGWPIGFYRRSLPGCQNFNPLEGDDPYDPAPVFLSHLDWDHWGYAYESGRPTKDARGFWKTQVTYRPLALQRTWVMRRPSAGLKLGASHAHLIYALQNQILHDGSCALKFWHPAQTHVQWGATLFTCSPVAGVHDTKYLRNNESLGMLVENQHSYYFRRVLLCGDADYTSIPAEFKQNLGGIVAPHHGGRVTPHSIPAPDVDAGEYCYMVFSTHQGCYSTIPWHGTITEASALGWKISRTDFRLDCECGLGERRNRWFALASYKRPSPWHLPSCRCLALL